MSRAELAVDVSDEIEIPCAVYDEIVSWQGVLGASVGDSNKTANFRLAAENLLRLGERQDPPVRQHIVDALYRMSVVADIDDAASQEIMADAAEPSSLERSSNMVSLFPGSAVNTVDTIPPAFSDEALALRFAETHAGCLRYVAAWGRWLSYDGTRWRFDNTLLSFDRAREICRAAAAECNKAKTATALASAKTVAAVVTLAKADRRLAGTVDQWDADPWLLNTPTNVIDLRTGTCRPHRLDDYMTKLTGIAPDARCSIECWLGFLDRVTGSNAELIAFIQRMAGYSLTGLTQEHAMFFCYGTGANGKTTLINVLTNCAGDYHRTAPIETFTDSANERHPTDLAGLRGARLVTAVETEEGRRWAESKIKALTGGDTISARFMRQDFFDYVPQFKLVIAGNHRPGLRSVDEAIRRRLHLVPFTITIPPKERDTELPDKLKTELPGILAWMVQGCLDWQKIGLAPPAAVTSATAAYLDAEDAVAAWIDDCCERDPQAWEQTSALFANWAAWAGRAGEHVGSQKRFSERLEARGAEPLRKRDGRGFVGIKLRSATY